MLTKKAEKLISETWSTILYHFDNHNWTHHASNLFDQSLIESKQHDRFRGDSINRGMSVYNEAKYFAIKRLSEYLHTNEKLDPANFLSYQKSCFHAYGIVHDQRFTSTWLKIDQQTRDNMKEIASWDYRQLIAADMPKTIEAAESHAKCLDDKSKSLELANYVYSSYLKFIKDLPANKKPKARLAPIS